MIPRLEVSWRESLRGVSYRSDELVDPDVGAPTFFEVIADPSVSELSLRAFLQTSHATMPNLILTPEETDDIIAYILTLRGVQPGSGRAGPRAQAP